MQVFNSMLFFCKLGIVTQAVSTMFKIRS